MPIPLPQTSDTMENIVLVAIVVLATIFVASFIVLMVICRYRFCRRKPEDYIGREHNNTSGDTQLVIESGPGRLEGAAAHSGLELEDVGLADLEQWLNDESWVDDATGLVPHCLSILRTCHQLTERMVTLTMNGRHLVRSTAKLNEIVNTAKQINPRVDEIIRAMYPPLDPRLLEARCTALFMSVRHLVMICQGHCKHTDVIEWIYRSLNEVDQNLLVLREASTNFDINMKAMMDCESCESTSSVSGATHNASTL